MSTRHSLQPDKSRRGGAALLGGRSPLAAGFVAVLIIAIAAVSLLLLVNHGSGTATKADGKSGAAAAGPSPHSSGVSGMTDSLSPVARNSAETVAPAGNSDDAGSTSPAAAGSTGTTASAKYVRYTVKPGDNLWVIADWFHQKGYQPIYQWNQTTIGKDPSLIRPGQTLIVAVHS